LPLLRTPHTTQKYNVLASAGRFDRLRWLVREMVAVDAIMPGRHRDAMIL
jgi:hypothetical protein